MPISYPSQGGGGSTTIINAAAVAPPYFPATVNTTFPVSVTGTTQTEIGTFFLPDPYLYSTSGSAYYVSVIGFVTGSSSGTGSLVIAPGIANIKVNLYYTDIGFGPLYQSAQLLDGNNGDATLVLPFDGSIPLPVPSISFPIYLSCSANDVTCSVTAIQFSYSGSLNI